MRLTFNDSNEKMNVEVDIGFAECSITINRLEVQPNGFFEVSNTTFKDSDEVFKYTDFWRFVRDLSTGNTLFWDSYRYTYAFVSPIVEVLKFIDIFRGRYQEDFDLSDYATPDHSGFSLLVELCDEDQEDMKAEILKLYDEACY